MEPSAKKVSLPMHWLAALGLAVLLRGTAQAQTGSITGQVLAADSGDPLAGAAVEISGPALAGKKGTIADEKGRYAIEKVPEGIYVVKVTYVGYVAGMVRKVAVTQGASAAVDFRLESASYALGETVVSASRHAENIVDAPVSISKVDWKELQRNTAGNSYVSAIKNVKGIDLEQMGILYERFNARGFNSALNTRMLLLIDGRVTKWVSGGGGPDYNASIVKDDLQDIEVIVGPGSAIYGPDAVSGVVNLTTKDPRRFQGTTAAFSGGSRDLLKGRFYHAGSKHRWGWKVSTEYQKAHDFELTNTFFNADSTLSVTDDPDFNSIVLRGGLGLFYYPDDESRVGISAGASSQDFIVPINTGRTQVDNWVYHYQHLNYTTPNLYLSLYNSGDNSGDSFGLHMDANNRLAGFPPEEARKRATFNGDAVLREAEARYRFRFSELHTTYLSVGSNLRQERTNSSIISAGGVVVNQAGFYGHAEADLSERFRAVLASRVDLHEVYGTQFSPKVALIFKPNTQTAVRVTFNRAYRSPGINDQYLLFPVNQVVVARGNGQGFRFGTTTGGPLSPQYEAGIPKLKPEENTTFEFGLKGVLASRIFLDLSGYRSRYRNFISPLTPIGDLRNGIVTLDENGNPRAGEVTLTYLNFGRQTVWGCDADMKVYATEHLAFKGNISLIEAGDLETTGTLNQPFNTPGAIFNLGLSGSDLLTRGTSLDLSLRRVSEYDFRSGVHVGTVRAYAVTDVHFGYRTKYGLCYKFSVTNLLDNVHREFVDGPEIGRLVVGEVEYAF